MASSSSSSASASASSAAAPASAGAGPVLDPNDLTAAIAGLVIDYASDKVNAALFSFVPGNAFFGLEALFTSSEDEAKKKEGVLTAFFGAPYTQRLDWETIQGRGWRLTSSKFMSTTRAALVPGGVYFLATWRGEHLPSLQTPIVFPAELIDTHNLTGDKVQALVQSTFATPPYFFTKLCGSVGVEPTIPGIEPYDSLFYVAFHELVYTIKNVVGPFKKE